MKVLELFHMFLLHPLNESNSACSEWHRRRPKTRVEHIQETLENTSNDTISGTDAAPPTRAQTEISGGQIEEEVDNMAFQFLVLKSKCEPQLFGSAAGRPIAHFYILILIDLKCLH